MKENNSQGNQDMMMELCEIFSDFYDIRRPRVESFRKMLNKQLSRQNIIINQENSFLFNEKTCVMHVSISSGIDQNIIRQVSENCV